MPGSYRACMSWETVQSCKVVLDCAFNCMGYMSVMRIMYVLVGCPVSLLVSILHLSLAENSPACFQTGVPPDCLELDTQRLA